MVKPFVFIYYFLRRFSFQIYGAYILRACVWTGGPDRVTNRTANIL